MIRLTTEQARQIEESLAFAASHSEYLADDLILYGEALSTIRAARAQADHVARADKMVREPVATLHDDGCFTWKSDEFRLLYDRQRAGWRMDVYASPVGPVKQEPVAWMCWIDSDEEKNPIKARLTSYEPKAYGKRKPLYAAPVRTKDLTDDEIYTLYSEPCSDREMVEFARAVIKAYQEKNK